MLVDGRARAEPPRPAHGCTGVERVPDRPRAVPLLLPAPAWMRAAVASAAAVLLLAFGAPAAGAAAEFPDGFLWGTAISGFQTEAGKGRNADPGSDWCVWTHDPGNIADGTVSGDLPEDGPGHWRHFRRRPRPRRRRAPQQRLPLLDRVVADLPPTRPRGSTSAPRSTRATSRRLDELANQRAVRPLPQGARGGGEAGDHPVRHPPPLDDPDLAARSRSRSARRSPAAAPTSRCPSSRRGAGSSREHRGRVPRSTRPTSAWKLGGRADFWNTLNEPMVQVTYGFVNVPGLLRRLLAARRLQLQPRAIAALLNLERANTVAYDALKRFDRARRRRRRARLARRAGDEHDRLHARRSRPPAATSRRPSTPTTSSTACFLNAVVDGDIDANADGDDRSRTRPTCTARKADFVGAQLLLPRSRHRPPAAPLTPAIPVLDFLPATSYASPGDPVGAAVPDDLQRARRGDLPGGVPRR